MKTASFLLLFFGPHLLLAQPDTFTNDPNFASKGRFNASALVSYSTVSPPPALIVDVTYGVTKRTTIGVTAGTTGALALVGIKANRLLWEASKMKVLLRFISVYYPERDGPFLFDRKDKYVMPWILTMAVIDSEWKLRNGIRINGGIGIMENHCLDDMKMWFNRNHKHHDIDSDGNMHGSLIDIFTTLTAGVSTPLSNRLTLKLEAIAVFHKTRLIHKDEFKVTFPINPYLNFVYAF
jgi:hypothetical protein